VKPLVIGQAPSSTSDPAWPLSGRSGRRLAALCGVDHGVFLDAFDRVNLIPVFPGKAGKGDAFPIEEARRSAAIVKAMSPRTVIILGDNVRRAFDVLDDAPMFRWFRLGPHCAAVAPHPSGVSRWWNDPMNAERARLFWRGLAAGSRP